MKRRITKQYWPFLLLGVAVLSFLLFMAVLEVTPGWMAWALSILLIVATGGAAVSTLTVFIRVVRKTKNWANAAETKKERIQRWVGLAIGYLFSLPFIYFWFAMIALVFGFLSIAIQQRQMYH
jgi:hypothetical protein